MAGMGEQLLSMCSEAGKSGSTDIMSPFGIAWVLCSIEVLDFKTVKHIHKAKLSKASRINRLKGLHRTRLWQCLGWQIHCMQQSVDKDYY